MADATTDYDDLQAFEAQLYTTFFEAVADNINIFNANSGGTILMDAGSITGERPEKAQFLNVDPVSDRIKADAVDKTYVKGTTGSRKGFVINKAANIADNISDFKLQGLDAMAMAASRGQSIADGLAKNAVDIALNALSGAINSEAGLLYSDPAAGASEANVTTVQRLFALKKKLGDAHRNIGAWFMHSNAYFDLMDSFGSTPSSATALATGVIVDSSLVSVAGAPIISVDNDIFQTAAVSSPAAGAQEHIFGLQRGAIELKIQQGSPLKTFEDRTVTPNVLVTDTEWDVEGFVKGMTYDQSSFDPTLANLASSANWTKVSTSLKDCCGIIGTWN